MYDRAGVFEIITKAEKETQNKLSVRQHWSKLAQSNSSDNDNINI